MWLSSDCFDDCCSAAAQVEVTQKAKPRNKPQAMLVAMTTAPMTVVGRPAIRRSHPGNSRRRRLRLKAI
jgi:hypothetical protein